MELDIQNVFHSFSLEDDTTDADIDDDLGDELDTFGDLEDDEDLPLTDVEPEEL